MIRNKFKSRLYFCHRLLRHIRRSHQTAVEELYDHALLSGYASHSAMNAFEFTFFHDDGVAQFELDVVRGDGDDMRILDGGKADEVVHGLLSNGKWRIAVGIVLATRCVVIVIG